MQKHEIISIDCSICLQKFNKSDKINILICKHQYHENCIKEWLVNNNSCPLCRSLIPIKKSCSKYVCKNFLMKCSIIITAILMTTASVVIIFFITRNK